MDGLPRLDKLPAQSSQIADEQKLLHDLESDEALLVATELQERNMDETQLKAFDEAKDAALRPWSENKAWKPVDASEARPGEAVPMRFLLCALRTVGSLGAQM